MTKEVTDTHEKGYPWTRTLVALAIGLVGSAFIWVVTPYVNFLIDTGLVSDSFLPVSSLFVILVLLLLTNPVLRLIGKLARGDGRTLALDRRQLALVFSIVLMAAVVTSYGLLRHLPYSIAFNNTQINSNSALAESVEKVAVPLERPSRPSSGHGRDGAGASERQAGEVLHARNLRSYDQVPERSGRIVVGQGRRFAPGGARPGGQDRPARRSPNIVPEA